MRTATIKYILSANYSYFEDMSFLTIDLSIGESVYSTATLNVAFEYFIARQTSPMKLRHGKGHVCCDHVTRNKVLVLCHFVFNLLCACVNALCQNIDNCFT